jgi:2-amino-4-hydroxy-6-hydroxymethyldihydropteridine diphosphokinase
VDPVKEKVYVSLGSNLGDRTKNMQQALMALRQEGIAVTKISSVYETEPVDYLDQPWFLNMAVEGETELAPAALLETLRGIETKMGSKKRIAKGPRLIDIDILLYAKEVVDTPELQIPHPRIHLRRFVLQPLAEIAPGVRHPILGMTAAEMLASTPDKSAVRIVSGF